MRKSIKFLKASTQKVEWKEEKWKLWSSIRLQDGIEMNQTLKSYCNKKYTEYLKLNYNTDKKYLYFILKKSQGDPRLALVAQSNYCAKGRFDIAAKFESLTKESYKNEREFLASDNKYVEQFLVKKASSGSGKRKLKKMIKKTMYDQGLSYYKISKQYGFSRSKLYDFFEYGKINVFSISKLMEINKTLKQAYKK